MILYGGCESSEIQSVVTLLLVDVKTEEEYVLAKGTYGIWNNLEKASVQATCFFYNVRYNVHYMEVHYERN